MFCLVLLLAAAHAFGQPVNYKIEPGAGSHISLEVEKTGLMKGKKHLFVFTRFSGRLSYDAQAPANSQAGLTIDAASLLCKDTWVSPKDLKKITDTALGEMLDVKRHPEIRFLSTRVTPRGQDTFQVEGILTIRGISKPVMLETALTPEGMMLDGKTRFKMTVYGMKPPSAALGAIGTKDEMTATFHVAGR